jgi:hypothetical protein
MRFCRSLLVLVSLALSCFAFGQSTNASLTGFVDDPAKALLSGVSITAINTQTGIRSQTFTNTSGQYVLPALIPGSYRIEVDKQGFRGIIEAGLILHVQDVVQMNFHMAIGSSSETVTVNAGENHINTTDASVSTVVDRQFVDTMPLNGRSFQSLILLAPGVVTATPQNGASQGQAGEFSVNGQRADANNFTVDGVSANNSPNPGGFSAAGTAGGLQATTALGTTQALVSVDALQEFKIQTSTYSAEFGRQPGAQISFETRSGTNNWHGSAFDYLRNDVFDANNWFNDDATPTTPKPAERQNDFGGTVGGPFGIPRLYSGKDRTFFFFSYEGLRLTQPEPAMVYYVPSTQLRQEAPAALQPVLNAFPLTNCTTATSSECVDPANGLSPLLLSNSLPSSLDAVSARVDQRVASWLNLFFRYGSSDSSAVQLANTTINSVTTNTKTFTLGGDSTIGSNITNQIRLNYSPAHASSSETLVNYGGAVPVDLLALNSIQSSAGEVEVVLDFPGYEGIIDQGTPFSKQHQWNLIDTLARKQGNHFLHFGLDYRRTSATTAAVSPRIEYIYLSALSVLANSPEVAAQVGVEQHPEYTNFSAFVQDEWRVTRAVNLSLGLRWELNPPPTVTSGAASRTIDGNFDNPASLTLAPAGTPLYHTTYYNFAPRVGMAAVLNNAAGRELVFRAGGGVFFDTGQQTNNIFGDGTSPGTGFFHFYTASSSNAFPFTSPLSIPLESTLTPPYFAITTISQHLQLPYTFQWNATLEQALGTSQSISLGYIGSNGRRLLEQNTYSPNNPAFVNGVVLYQNGLSSSYNALQIQYKRTLSRGLQALASYTWAHALDYQSQDDGFYPYQRGNSDFDVRNNFTAALSYDLPKELGSHLTSAFLGAWGADLRLTARTGFPVTFQGNSIIDPITGINAYSGLDVVPGVPVYLHGAQYPGGRSINPTAFALPSGTSLGNAPRNFARGFGENEVNFAIRKSFPIHDRLQLQFRAEAFNVFNHPNFGFINPYYGGALFGQATETLASSIGGLTSLYQQGGPRSLQFSLRLQF